MRDLLSGLTLWPNSGFLFAGSPGMAGITAGAAHGALAERVVRLRRRLDGDAARAISRSRRLRLARPVPSAHPATGRKPHVRAAGCRSARAAISPRWWRRKSHAGSWPRAPCTAASPTATASALAAPVVVVEKDGRPVRVGAGARRQLPADAAGGRLRALCDRSRLRAQRTRRRCGSAAGTSAVRDFRDLGSPGRASKFGWSTPPAAHRSMHGITISQGERPLVEFLGRTHFLHRARAPGYSPTSTLAPGDYRVHGLRGRRIPRARGARDVERRQRQSSRKRRSRSRGCSPARTRLVSRRICTTTPTRRKR